MSSVSGVVIIFDEAEKKAFLSVPVEKPDDLIGKEAIFEQVKGKVFKGRVVGVESDLVVVQFERFPLGLGQGSMVTINM